MYVTEHQQIQIKSLKEQLRVMGEELQKLQDMKTELIKFICYMETHVYGYEKVGDTEIQARIESLKEF